jgi:hypothetical protein
MPLLAACAIHAVLAAVCARGDDPLMTDSRQYVDVARHIAAGDGIVTGVLSIDRATTHAGTELPPYAHHPPGFPILIALASRAGLTPERAVLVLPIVGSLATLLLLHRLARRVVPAHANLVALLYALAVPFAENANHALSEPVFLALLVGVLLVGGGDAVRAFPGSPRRALATGLLCGSLFAVRYTAVAAIALLAALVVAPALAGSAADRARARRPAIAWALGVAAIAGPVAALAFAARSLDRLPPPLVGPLGNLVWWVSHVGQDLALTFPRPAAGALPHAPLGALLLLAAPLWLWRTRCAEASARDVAPAARPAPRAALDPAVAFCTLYPLVHVAWLTAARSLLYINTSATRHLISAYPFLLIVLARAIAPGGRARAPALAFLALYAAGQIATAADDVRLPSAPPDLGHVPTWIANHTAPGDAIVATEAELLVHLVPDRRYVALVRWPYAGRTIEAADVPLVRDRAGARWLIVLTGMGSQALAGAYGGFVKSILENGGGDGVVRTEMPTGAVVFAIEGAP